MALFHIEKFKKEKVKNKTGQIKVNKDFFLEQIMDYYWLIINLFPFMGWENRKYTET